jgi:hypothetical protein
MSNHKHDAKIEWFKLRTGCSEQEAKKFLDLSKWKLEIAIRERNLYLKQEQNNIKNNGGFDWDYLDSQEQGK